MKTRTDYLMSHSLIFTACWCGCLVIPIAHAQAAVTLDWATVGNPGNDGEVQSQGTFGAVDYVYRISKYEVTNEQYREYLNAVDPTGINPHDVFDMGTMTSLKGGISFNPGAALGNKYSLKPNMGNKPTNYITYFDALRFINWLENGQPTDGTGTESGVYDLNDDFHAIRSPIASYFLPNENEWYKAAYYDPRPEAAGGPPDDDNYWLYPTASDSEPTLSNANSVGDISNPGPNVATYFRSGDWNGIDGNITTVGSAGEESTSFYGTSDQAANVVEWNEYRAGTDPTEVRISRGGSWSGTAVTLLGSYRYTSSDPDFVNSINGFRVASLSSLPGDFDIDGIVDGNDFLAWQRGESINSLSASDLATWRASYGNVAISPSNVAVPEPASWVLVGGMALHVLLCRRVSDTRLN